MRIVIAGGSGQIGSMLAREYVSRGYETIVLGRHPARRPWRVVQWDGRTLGAWGSELERADALINLAGRSVNCRYTPANQHEIMASRIDSTRVLGEAIAAAANPPPIWLQASTATIYAHRFDAGNDEASGILGGEEPDAPKRWRFSIEVATAWEQACSDAPTPGTRKVLLRSAMVMSPDPGGIFATLLMLVRRGLGGRAGDGRQYVSWIHDRDFIRALDRLIEHDALSGPVNLASPNPLPNAQFMAELRSAAHVYVGLPAPAALLELGALFMRTETELLLKSRRVVPGRLMQSGFEFLFPQWPSAARDLRSRAIGRSSSN